MGSALLPRCRMHKQVHVDVAAGKHTANQPSNHPLTHSLAGSTRGWVCKHGHACTRPRLVTPSQQPSRPGGQQTACVHKDTAHGKKAHASRRVPAWQANLLCHCHWNSSAALPAVLGGSGSSPLYSAVCWGTIGMPPLAPRPALGSIHCPQAVLPQGARDGATPRRLAAAGCLPALPEGSISRQTRPPLHPPRCARTTWR